MAAGGVVGLTEVFTESIAIELNARGDRLREKLNEVALRRGVPVTVTGVGSLMNIHFSAEPITSPDDVAHASAALKPLLHLDMLLNGIYLARRGLHRPIHARDRYGRQFCCHHIRGFPRPLGRPHLT